MNTKLAELKQLCKIKAEILKKLSQEIKKLQREDKYAGKAQREREAMKLDYRLLHIAYCMLRGKSYEQIEQPKRDWKKLSTHDWETIEQYKKDYYEVAETLHPVS